MIYEGILGKIPEFLGPWLANWLGLFLLESFGCDLNVHVH
jgi:hypothetical protein